MQFSYQNKKLELTRTWYAASFITGKQCRKYCSSNITEKTNEVFGKPYSHLLQDLVNKTTDEVDILISNHSLDEHCQAALN